MSVATEQFGRLAQCLECMTLSKLPPFEGNPADDAVLQDWIDRHMHGRSVEAHKGGQVYVMEAPAFSSIGGRQDLYDAIERETVEKIKGSTSRANSEMWELRDELREDAGTCFLKHGSPDYNDGHPCPDYHGAGKENRLGENTTHPEVLARIEELAHGGVEVFRP